MSAFKIVECNINDRDELVAGLKGLGFSSDEIEVHDNPVLLANYDGHLGPQKGNVVVRRNNFKKRTKASWNADLGFEKTGNEYKIHLNQEEQKWWNSQEPRFKQAAAEHKVITAAKKRGYHVRSVPSSNGNIKLKLIKNF
jgi:hypothetical protein